MSFVKKKQIRPGIFKSSIRLYLAKTFIPSDIYFFIILN